MAKVYLVLPDLSRPKLEAIAVLSKELCNLGLLVSFYTLKTKPELAKRVV